jgi:receptor protein-tyrosine kinase
MHMARSAKGGRIGDVLVDCGKLTREQADHVAAMQNERGMRFGDAAVELGLMSAEDFQLMQIVHGAEGSRVGDILVNSGRLTREQADIVAAMQNEQGMRFGEAAIKLRAINPCDLQFALARQYGYACFDESDAPVSGELATICQPLGQQAEALRALRSELALRWFGGEPNRSRLAVVGSEAGCGRSYLAANLAVVFSHLGARTLLVDADMRHPSQHRLFNLDNRFGLSSILANRSNRRELIRQSSLSGMSAVLDLSVMTAGPQPPNPQELLGRKCFAAFLDEIDDDFDVIILDTPPAAHYADAKTIAVRAQGALLATRKNQTSLRDASRLCTSLAELRVTVVGSVLSEF